MRRLVLLAVSVGTLALPGARASASDHIQFDFPASIHIEEDDRGHLKLRITENGHTIKADARGNFELNDAEDDFAKLDVGGHFHIEERHWGRTRHVMDFKGLPGGEIERTYRRGGTVMPLDDEGRAWLRDALQTIVNQTDFDSESHLDRVLARSGVDGAFADIAHVSGDHAQRARYEYLLERQNNDVTTAARIAAAAPNGIGSDHELAELLLHLMECPAGLDEGVRLACAKGSERLGSDYERRRTLAGIIGRGPVTEPVAHAILKSARGIGSDHELAETLVAFVYEQNVDASNASEFFAAADGIGSDYEKRRTMISTLSKHGDVDVVRAGATRTSEGIGSDHERAEVLKAVADDRPVDPDLAPAFFQAVHGIGSDHEHGAVLLSALRQGDMAPASLHGLIACANDIGSDTRKAEVLIEVARSQKLDADLERDFMDAAEKIGSDHERGRVLDALHDRHL